MADDRDPRTELREVLRWTPEAARRAPDHVATEAPLQIELMLPGGEPFVAGVWMRTPGDDEAFVRGWLLHEGWIAQAQELLGLHVVSRAVGTGAAEVVRARLGVQRRDPTGRGSVTSGACGTCGVLSLAELEPQGLTPVPEVGRWSAAQIARWPEQLRAVQEGFRRSGGMHAAAAFDGASRLIDWAEDVGRHNALDKLAGRQLTAEGGPLAGRAVLLSGRASYELVVKAVVSRVALVAAVGAPSSLAVRRAHQGGITLIGFVRTDRMNIYTHPQRVHGEVLHGR